MVIFSVIYYFYHLPKRIIKILMREGVSVQHEDLSLCFGNFNIRLKPAHESQNAGNPHELTRLS